MLQRLGSVRRLGGGRGGGVAVCGGGGGAGEGAGDVAADRVEFVGGVVGDLVVVAEDSEAFASELMGEV